MTTADTRTETRSRTRAHPRVPIGTRIRALVRAVAGSVAGTVTAAGWLVVGATIAGLVAGLSTGWTIGWVAAVAGAALLVGSAPFLLGGSDYRVRLELDRTRVVAGSELEAVLHVTNAARRLSLPGVVDVPIGPGLVEAQVPLLRPGAVHDAHLGISARRRGVIAVGPLSVTRGDPVGILRRTESWPEVQTVHVHPVTAPIPSTSAGVIRDLEGLPTSDIVDADLAFHAIRGYLPGDSRRHVHWKSTAKTGALMVRQYEETRDARIAVLLGAAGEGEYAGDEEFELAVSVAASLGLQAMREGRELAVATSVARSAGMAVRTLPTRTAMTMLDGFAEVEGDDAATSLVDAARIVAGEAERLSVVFVVTGSRLGVDRLRAAAAAFGDAVQTVVVRCEEHAEPVLRSAGTLRIITVGAIGDLGKLIARGALA